MFRLLANGSYHKPNYTQRTILGCDKDIRHLDTHSLKDSSQVSVWTKFKIQPNYKLLAPRLGDAESCIWTHTIGTQVVLWFNLTYSLTSITIPKLCFHIGLFKHRQNNMVLFRIFLSMPRWKLVTVFITFI